MSFKAKQIALFTGALVILASIVATGVYIMVVMIPPAIDAFVKSFAQ